MKFRFIRTIRHLEADQQGAVLVEFAIIVPIIIFINILIYDLSSYFRMAERSNHAAQLVQNMISNDSDHKLTLNDLDRATQYFQLVVGERDAAQGTAMVVINAMPIYSNRRWTLVACWAWSSDPSIAPPPFVGARLSPALYPADPWIPTNGLTASSAILIVETHQKFDALFGVNYLPSHNNQVAIGPVRYIPAISINLLLQKFFGGPVLNDSTIRDPNAGNAILCQR